jgi:hypothetical protein
MPTGVAIFASTLLVRSLGFLPLLVFLGFYLLRLADIDQIMDEKELAELAAR